MILNRLRIKNLLNITNLRMTSDFARELDLYLLKYELFQ